MTTGILPESAPSDNPGRENFTSPADRATTFEFKSTVEYAELKEDISARGVNDHREERP